MAAWPAGSFWAPRLGGQNLDDLGGVLGALLKQEGVLDAVDKSPFGVKVREKEVLLELLSTGDELTPGIEDGRVTVEDELVLATY